MAASQICLLLVALLTLTASTSCNAEATIYEFLSQFGFPPGILPDSVRSYKTVPAIGGAYYFNVFLNKPCYVEYDFFVRFDTKISGTITNRKITNMRGLTAQPLGGSYLWFDIDGMKVDDSKVSFTLGLATLVTKIALFETMPTCHDSLLAAFDHSSKQTKLISQLPITAE